MTERIGVLDDTGYVRLAGVQGHELDIIDAARVSFDRQSSLDENGNLRGADHRLLKFLLKHNHMSPFRHVHLSFEVYAPLVVVRQHVKHIVGSSFIDEGISYNEVSKRYVAEADEFYVPAFTEWRSAPENKKQGSGDVIPPVLGFEFTDALLGHIEQSKALYEEALEAGIAPEQARLFLPAYAMYVRYRWNVSLHGMFNFLTQRLDSHAQHEIREYAKAFDELTQQAFPDAYAAWTEV